MLIDHSYSTPPTAATPAASFCADADYAGETIAADARRSGISDPITVLDQPLFRQHAHQPAHSPHFSTAPASTPPSGNSSFSSSGDNASGVAAIANNRRHRPYTAASIRAPSSYPLASPPHLSYYAQSNANNDAALVLSPPSRSETRSMGTHAQSQNQQQRHPISDSGAGVERPRLVGDQRK